MVPEKIAPQVGPAAHAARELAYRRWRPQTTPATAKDPSARLLAHHRWGTMPENIAATAPPIGDAAINVTAFAVLAAAAVAVNQGRKSAMQSEPAAVDSQAAWRPWLIAGSVIAAGALLLFSEGAPRYWGLIVGLECLLLAVVLPAPESGQQRGLSG